MELVKYSLYGNAITNELLCIITKCKPDSSFINAPKIGLDYRMMALRRNIEYIHHNLNELHRTNLLADKKIKNGACAMHVIAAVPVDC